MTLLDRLTQSLFGSRIATEVKAKVRLATKALDDITDRMLHSGSNTEGWRDRYAYDRVQQLADSLEAWRVNPLARRIVGLTTQYVVGAGITVESKDEATNTFLKLWWNHPLNRMPIRVMEWCDELSRSGEVFALVSTNPADGMTYLRAVPAADIDDILTAANDVEQPMQFVGFPDPETRIIPVYNAYNPAADDGLSPVMIQFTINRPVGAKRGESDLAPLLKWFARLSSLLEDRVRLNRYRQAFLYIIRGVFPDAATRIARQAELNANPPSPGSILVTDAANEAWGVLNPQLGSFEAGEDILAVKKMIAAGSGNPLHFLAEPEGSTRTTAESAGGPTFRHYQQRQILFLWVIETLARIALDRRSRVDSTVKPDAPLTVRGTDISARDNAALAIAASTIVAAFKDLYDRGLIDEAELLRLSYTFAGELVDIPDLLKRVVPPRVPIAQPGKPDTGADGSPTSKSKSPGKINITEEGDTGKLQQQIEELVGAIRESPLRESPQHAPSPIINNYLPAAAPINIHNQLPDQPAPVTHVTNQIPDQPAPTVIVEAAPPTAPIVNITNQIPDQPAPTVIVEAAAPAPAPIVNVHNQLPDQPAPAVLVEVAAPVVNIENKIKFPTVVETSVVERNDEGQASKIVKTVKPEADE